MEANELPLCDLCLTLWAPKKVQIYLLFFLAVFVRIDTFFVVGAWQIVSSNSYEKTNELPFALRFCLTLWAPKKLQTYLLFFFGHFRWGLTYFLLSAHMANVTNMFRKKESNPPFAIFCLSLYWPQNQKYWMISCVFRRFLLGLTRKLHENIEKKKQARYSL